MEWTMCVIFSGIADPCEVAFVTVKCIYNADPDVSLRYYFDHSQDDAKTDSLYRCSFIVSLVTPFSWVLRARTHTHIYVQAFYL
jgi:hypothetical protein